MNDDKMHLSSEIDGEKRCIDALRSALKKGNVSTYRYSIGGYSEEAVCIEKDGAHWIVYDGERGRKCNLKNCSSIKSGCIEILKRIFVDKDGFTKARRAFYSELQDEITITLQTGYFPVKNMPPKFFSSGKRANMCALKASIPPKRKKGKVIRIFKKLDG